MDASMKIKPTPALCVSFLSPPFDALEKETHGNLVLMDYNSAASKVARRAGATETHSFTL
jgi:hypothetical protein